MSSWLTIQIQIISNSITNHLCFDVALIVLKEAISVHFIPLYLSEEDNIGKKIKDLGFM